MILFIQIYLDYLYIILLFVEGSEYRQIQIVLAFKYILYLKKILKLKKKTT